MPEPIAAVGIETSPVSLLTVARRLPSGTDWRSGVSFLPNGCSPAVNFPTCEVDPAPPTKCVPNFQPRAEFDSWPIYVPDGCNEKPFWIQDWRGRAFEALEAYTPWALSRELDDGAMSGNPSLRSTAVDITGAGAVDVVTAVSSLLRARVEQGFAGVGLLHVPAWLIPPMYDRYLLEGNGPILTTCGGLARVSPGPGYTGVSPDSSANLVPGPGEGWVYITDPVEYEISSPVLLPDDPDDQQHRTNNIELYAERMAIYRFNPCGSFAVRVGVNA